MINLNNYALTWTQTWYISSISYTLFKLVDENLHHWATLIISCYLSNELLTL